VSSWSLLNDRSTSPPQSLQARNFSTIHAASPVGESSAQVLEVGVGDVHVERLDLRFSCHHAPTPSRSQRQLTRRTIGP